MAKNLSPKCRFCGAKVKYFGDLCTSCDEVTERDEDGNPVADFMTSLNRQEQVAQDERMDLAEGVY